MSAGDESRRQADLERDIETTRAHLGETLTALQDRLSPEVVRARAAAHIRSRLRAARVEAIRLAREQPLLVAALGASVLATLASRLMLRRGRFFSLAVGAGLGALLYGGARHRQRQGAAQPTVTAGPMS